MSDYDYRKAEELVLQTRALIAGADALEVGRKGDFDYVTNVDLAVSDFLKGALAASYPDIGFFSEEEAGGLSANCWVLDPIDGTTNFIFGRRDSSVSLAHVVENAVQFALVFNPYTGEVCSARRGAGAFRNHGERLAVSRRPLEESLIEFGAGSTHKDEADENFAVARRVFAQCLDLRRMCSTALVLTDIAAARLDGYFEKRIKPWDIAAGSLILEEAGGRVTDYDGRPIGFAAETTIVASNGVNHDALLRAVIG